MKFNKQELLDSLKYREKICWDVADVFLQNKDAHGIHDMGVEIQALQRAIAEIEKLGEPIE
jgi:hypothetical protein